MLPLMYVKTGDVVKICKITGKDEIKKHLNDLGFVDGAIGKVISSYDGDVILNLKNSRIAATKTMSERIMIELVDEQLLYKTKIENK